MDLSDSFKSYAQGNRKLESKKRPQRGEGDPQALNNSFRRRNKNHRSDFLVQAEPDEKRVHSPPKSGIRTQEIPAGKRKSLISNDKKMPRKDNQKQTGGA